MRPLWFGPEDRPLFGWLHSPENGCAHGAVLLCPTIGIEAVNARYAYLHLADRLAEAGFVSLRFDYDGTGDSAGGHDDPGRVGAWLSSIRHATELLRALGARRISVVGLRMGATLAGEAFGSGPAAIDDLVLWDPCASGRSFLREQSALWTFALGTKAAGDGSVETPGLVYDKETVVDMSPLAIANEDGPMAGRVLVLMRAGRNGDRRMNERLDMPHVDRASILGQEELVDVLPDAAKVPQATVAAIVEWLSSGAGTIDFVVDPNTIGRAFAVVGETPAGSPVEERAVSLGPISLFGIMTSPRQPAVMPGEPSDLPTVIFLNAGVIDHVGPARLWVRLSRSWAEAGFRAVRFDVSGLGDSPVHPGQSGLVVLAPQADDDVLDVLRAVSPGDPSNAILIGLCSGGFHAIATAPVSKVRGLCAVNPILTLNLQEAEPDQGRTQSKGGMKGWVGKMPAYDRINRIVQRLPSSAWWIINRIAVDVTPARKLARAVDVGVNVLVIAGTDEGRWLRGGETRTMRQLERTGRFRMEVIPGLEHTLLEQRTREIAVGILTEHVVGTFGAPTTH